MTRRFLAAFLVVLLAAPLFAADEPWKDKSYKQWDSKDVMKVLNDSPWYQKVTIGGSGSQQSAITAISPATEGKNTTITGGTKADLPADSGVSYFVRWASARTIREALARVAVLRGAEEAKADEFLAQEPADYAISVSGQNMSVFAKTDEMALKQKAYLQVKKTKQKVSPSRVEIRRAGDSQRVAEVTFYFSKKAASGEALIPPDEKQLEFGCESGGTSIKAKFEPPKMVNAKGVDL